MQICTNSCITYLHFDSHLPQETHRSLFDAVFLRILKNFNPASRASFNLLACRWFQYCSDLQTARSRLTNVSLLITLPLYVRYPPDTGFCVLKVFMFLVSAATGMVFGKYFIHKFLFCRVLKLKMFSESGQVRLLNTTIFTGRPCSLSLATCGNNVYGNDVTQRSRDRLTINKQINQK